MLNEVAPHVRAGDIVVLSLEYEDFGGGYNPVNIGQLIEYRPAHIRLLGAIHFRRVLLRRGLAILGGITRRAIASRGRPQMTSSATGPAYTRSGFNAWGDLTSHHHLPSTFVPPAAGPEKPLTARWLPGPRVLRKLRDFGELCHSRGAVFAFTCPPHPATVARAEKRTLEAIVEALRTVPHLRILDSPADQVYADAQFYDTGYHLTQEGKQLRTRKLIQALHPLLPVER